MRKEAKVVKQTTLHSVGQYHGGVWNESYAFHGFKSNKYFTSDRFIPLTEAFARADGKPLKGYGLEIETECNGIGNTTVLAEVLQKIVFSHFPADLFKLERDGSLDGDSSAECITQVMTREFIRNHYSSFRLMYDTYFPAFRISCGSNCGMHCNISRSLLGANEKTQTEAVRKLYYIVNHHYDFCCELFNRDHRNTHYCSRMQHSKDYCRTLDPNSVMGGHGISFNFDHWESGRVELRLVGGQKSFGCFRNTMESIFHLVDAVKRLSWAECDDLGKVFAGCNQFVYDRLTRCRTAGYLSNETLHRIEGTVKTEDLI